MLVQLARKGEVEVRAVEVEEVTSEDGGEGVYGGVVRYGNSSSD